MSRVHGIKSMLAACLVLMGAMPSDLQGFVANFNENGAAQHWFKPGSSIFVSPNVIHLGTRTVRYFIDQTAFSEANRENELEAIRSAFDQWSQIPGTQLNFAEAGFIQGTPEVNLFDNTNMVYWEKNSTLVNNELDDIRGSLGLTFRAFFEDFNLVEADIVFNGIERQWYTDYDANIVQSVYVEAIAMHEVGHLLGMEHSTSGTSTMMFQAQLGLNSQLVLSPDDIAFVQTYYPAPGTPAQLGTVRGRVTRDGTGIHGAVVILENLQGDLIHSTITRTKNQVWEDGFYELPAVPPGNYQIRICPLDPNTANQFLLRGSVIIFDDYNDAPTDFTPTESQQISITAGGTVTHDVSLGQAQPTFSIYGIQPRVPNLSFLSIERAPARLKQGDRNVFVGIYGEELPSENAEFTVRGSGMTLGIKQYRKDFFGNADAWLIEVTVADDATPGSRSFELRQGDQVAYANGFLEIEAKEPDVNGDNLNDIFQRTYFTRWTADQAGPNHDADNDGFSNMEEYEAGSDPTLASSTPLTAVPPYALLSIETTLDGASITFESRPGAKYQLFSRGDILGDPWIKRGEPVIAQGDTTILVDPEAGDAYRFYRIETVP